MSLYNTDTEKLVLDYAKLHGKKEAFLYNNRLFFSIMNRNDLHKQQYSINRQLIINL